MKKNKFPVARKSLSLSAETIRNLETLSGVVGGGYTVGGTCGCPPKESIDAAGSCTHCA